MKVIGAGLGRTGTFSLKLAINDLGLGPCYHMEAVAQDQATRVPQWNAAVTGQADWNAIFNGFTSAVDWPVATFYRELHAAYPEARFVLTIREPEKWAASFGGTIFTLIKNRDKAPEAVRPWLEMSRVVIERSGFSFDFDETELAAACTAHNEAVKAAIPADRLLVMHIADGWAPLCTFLGVPVPDTPFPVSNSREEFWDLVNNAM